MPHFWGHFFQVCAHTDLWWLTPLSQTPKISWPLHRPAPPQSEKRRILKTMPCNQHIFFTSLGFSALTSKMTHLTTLPYFSHSSFVSPSRSSSTSPRPTMFYETSTGFRPTCVELQKIMTSDETTELIFVDTGADTHTDVPWGVQLWLGSWGSLWADWPRTSWKHRLDGWKQKQK